MKVPKLFRTCLLQRRLWGTRAPRRDTVRAHIMSDVTCCLLQDTRDDLEPRNSLHPLPLRPLTMVGSVRQSRKYVGRRLKALIECFLINTRARRGGGWRSNCDPADTAPLCSAVDPHLHCRVQRLLQRWCLQCEVSWEPCSSNGFNHRHLEIIN